MAADARRAFVLRKLHSLSGVVPLGAFLLEHLWTNASALGGREPFDEAVRRIQRVPGLVAFEVVGIWLPLAFHAGFGLRIALAGRSNALAYPYPKNWLYLLQRVSGVVALAFLLFHLWEYRLAKAVFGLRAEDMYPALEANLSSTTGGVPVRALAYVAGIGATVFHFANGLLGFAQSWGMLVSKRAQARAGWAVLGLGSLLFVLGLQIVVFFATGSRIFLPSLDEGADPPEAAASSSRACPAPSPSGRSSP